MSDSNKKVKYTKDQIAGRAKEKFGDATKNEELELKGKIQSSTADAKKNTVEMKEKAGNKLGDMKSNAAEMKEDAAGKMNDFIDDKKSKTHARYKPSTIIAAVVVGLIGGASLTLISSSYARA